MKRLESGTRVLVNHSVFGWTVQATWCDTFHDGQREMHVVRLDEEKHGSRYWTLSRYEFLY